MAATQKQRFIVVGGIVLIVVLGMLAFFGANTAKEMTVAEAAQHANAGDRVKVAGTVVNDSFSIQGDILTFTMADKEDPRYDLRVSYDKGVAATFGNGIEAICTGSIDEDGVLKCSELITKCPSKYESRTDALPVSRLFDYGDSIVNKVVKVQGVLKAGTLKDATADVRFAVSDAEDAKLDLPVTYTGALSEDVVDGASLVLTGTLNADGKFTATEVALEG